MPVFTVADFEVGERVTWLHEMRGGYGYTQPVDGLVTKIGRMRVQIEVKSRSGAPRLRWVAPTNLRKKE